MSSGRTFYKPVRMTRGYREILSEARQAYRTEGPYYIIKKGFMMILDYFWLWYYKTFKSSDTFEFQGSFYRYFFHPNLEKVGPSWKNERAVAIPILWNAVKKYQEQKKKILEVGNVLSYVFDVHHDILDKYEIIDGVINEDVAEFKPSKQYDLIVSMVTLEHVGWSEIPQDNLKIMRSLENLKTILAPGGQMIVIVGLGYNPEMDKLLNNGELQFGKQGYLKQISKYRWQQVNWEDVKDAKYDESVPTATGIVVGIIEK